MCMTPCTPAAATAAAEQQQQQCGAMIDVFTVLQETCSAVSTHTGCQNMSCCCHCRSSVVHSLCALTAQSAVALLLPSLTNAV
jgi:hypothetical protein